MVNAAVDGTGQPLRLSYLSAATLDVKNAFNSVRWDKMLDAFERDMEVSSRIFYAFLEII